jgi:hypothetical protein
LESIQKIEKIISTSENEELVDYARYALHEAQYLYYAPNDDKEERELILLKSMVEKEDHLWELNSLGEGFEYELAKVGIENEVEKKLIERMKPEEIAEDDGYEEWLIEQIEEINDECEYWQEWIKEAEGMITVKKYQEIPQEVVMNIHLDGEDNLDELDADGGEFDDMCDDEFCDCGCDEDEECDCDEKCDCCSSC